MKRLGIFARLNKFTPWNKGKHGIFSEKTGPREEYEKVMNLRKEYSWGGVRISKLTGIPISTIEDWIYKGKKPWVLKVTQEFQ